MTDEDDLVERIDDIENDAPNEQVEELLDIIRILQKRAERVESRNEALSRRLRSLEKFTGLHDEVDVESMMATKFDHRDRAVLQSLKARNPKEVSLGELRELYRKRTDVRGEETFRDRLELLTKHGPFEGRHPPWEFTAHQD